LCLADFLLYVVVSKFVIHYFASLNMSLFAIKFDRRGKRAVRDRCRIRAVWWCDISFDVVPLPLVERSGTAAILGLFVMQHLSGRSSLPLVGIPGVIEEGGGINLKFETDTGQLKMRGEKIEERQS
jgi:hypothetical protein